MKRTGFKWKPRKPLKRTRLRVVGTSTVSEQKREIQSLLRAIVIDRDGGCILRDYRHCGGLPAVWGVVLQADHLISRSNSATFADSRLVVCVCKPCHAWKSLGSNLRKAEYDRLVKTILPKERVELWEKCEQDSWRPVSKGATDWKFALIVLKQELDKLSPPS